MCRLCKFTGRKRPAGAVRSACFVIMSITGLCHLYLRLFVDKVRCFTFFRAVFTKA